MSTSMVVIFRLHRQEYAVDIAGVQEIVRLVKITHVPRAPRHIKGVINLRGNILPVVDLHGFFSLPPRVDSERTRIVIIRSGGRTMGFIVDEVLEVRSFNLDALEPPPYLEEKKGKNFARGVIRLGERLVMLLNVDVIMNELLQAGEENGRGVCTNGS